MAKGRGVLTSYPKIVGVFQKLINRLNSFYVKHEKLKTVLSEQETGTAMARFHFFQIQTLISAVLAVDTKLETNNISMIRIVNLVMYLQGDLGVVSVLTKRWRACCAIKCDEYHQDHQAGQVHHLVK